jgi:GntR family transcriptional regulator, phosphonate transport system regulatory protein
VDPVLLVAAAPDSGLPFPPAPVRRAAAEPLYAQVARDVAGHVRRGTLAAGQRLPAEPVLAQAYGVNRLTVREALASLARQGLVRRVQGVGSFVADAPVRHRVDASLASVTDGLRRRGATVREDLLEVAPGPPEAVPGGGFPAFPGPVTILWMRRLVDDVPWALSLVWLPAGLVGPDVRPSPGVSLAAQVEQRHGLRMVPADRVVTAAPAAPSDSEHLDVAPGTPLIVLSGGDVDQHGRRIAQESHRIRGDRAEYAVDFRGHA